MGNVQKRSDSKQINTVLSKEEIRYIYRIFYDSQFRLMKVGFIFDV
jgi:hypothetical protein